MALALARRSGLVEVFWRWRGGGNVRFVCRDEAGGGDGLSWDSGGAKALFVFVLVRSGLSNLKKHYIPFKNVKICCNNVEMLLKIRIEADNRTSGKRTKIFRPQMRNSE